MARLIHLSDLHFGAHDPRLVEAIESRVDEEKPDLVVISGDFTQRARTEQFQEACNFLERLRDSGHDVLAVPGNHDVPLYDVFRRFLSPLTRYKRYIDETLCPFHELPGVALLGINTARSLTFKDGRISHEQLQFIRETFERADPKSLRVLVTHHPLFELPVGETGDVERAVGRSDLALEAAADAGVDILLAGHHHVASTHSARDLVDSGGTGARRAGGHGDLDPASRRGAELQPHRHRRRDRDPGSAGLEGRKFESSSVQMFELEDDHWRVAGAEKSLDEPAH